MLLFDALTAAYPFLWPTAFAVVLYGVRYLAIAGVMYLFVAPAHAGGWGRTLPGIPQDFDAPHHAGRELRHSLLTILVFGLVNGVLYSCGLIQASLLYFRPEDHPVWWFWLSIPLMFMLHDTLFYWLHRLMHLPLLFGTMHRVHHRSVHPTAFAAYSFHPTEALAEALIVSLIIFIIPVHPLAFLIFQTLSTVYNIYGHCGREFYPEGMSSHWLGRWINTSTAHAIHHLKGRMNYGLYFMFWDRLMHTAETASLDTATRTR